MFKDYYQILDIPPKATQSEIKAAYRKQALKWHPDRNPNMDVKAIMQDINEAYAMLKDPASRARYDQEYAFFQECKAKQSGNDSSVCNNNYQNKHNHNSNKNNYRQRYQYDYNVKDEDLKEDIRNASEYARKLVDEFFCELRRNSKLVAQGAWDGAIGYVYVLIFMTIIGFMFRACVS